MRKFWLLLISVCMVGAAFAGGRWVFLSYYPTVLSKAVASVLSNQLAPAVEKALIEREDRRIRAQRIKILDQWRDSISEPTNGRHIYGNLEARFTLLEFSDLECSYCKRLHATLKLLTDCSNGRLNWEWKHYPLESHNPVAKKAALSAECVAQLAGNQAFWGFNSEWFARSRLGGRGMRQVEDLTRILGIPDIDYQKCMDDSRYSPLLVEHIASADAMGISGVPALVIIDHETGNKILISGSFSFETLLDKLIPFVETAVDVIKI